MTYLVVLKQCHQQIGICEIFLVDAHPQVWHNYIAYICIINFLHSENDVTSSLAGILPVLAGQIEDILLFSITINSGCLELLIHLLTLPNSRLLKLELSSCDISNSDYCHLTTAIPTSNLTHFTSNTQNINVSIAMGIAEAMTQSKTLEEVAVDEGINLENGVLQVLLEAMNHSSMKKLKLRPVHKNTVIQCSYPIDKVEITYF